ncbi:manganese-transporting P-type ATPase [Pancytospora epiphaga]|nr:manganese-transporting P-type ATPase [Pancytospora epiphaga]
MHWVRYRQNHPLVRLYLIPLYLMPFITLLTSNTKAVVISCMLTFGLMYLSTYWTVRSHILQCFKKDRNGLHILYEHTLCKITPEKSNKTTFLTFFYRHTKYILEENLVIKIAPRLDFPLSSFKNGTTHRNYELFPPNSVEIPIPSFWKLFKDQCVTPLFCFQIFSSVLMAFDDYVLQSIFSTCAIVVVEAILVFSRVHTISQFRSLSRKECEVIKLKGGYKGTGEEDGKRTSSVELKPGDFIKITEPTDVPCDLLILRGSCAVNEAMLSGESVPLPKVAIPESNEILDLKKHKSHILFSGTNIEKMEEAVYAVVLRTAFDTEQGILLNKMLNSEDIKYDPEALRFIMVLAALSLLSSIFTFLFSKKTGYPLFIDLIVLFTNSIPFEMPMEMGISVQRAVRHLSSVGVHCLEPFRVTLAGKVDVCCFDKTGTLTESKLMLKRVVCGCEATNSILCYCHGLILVDGVHRGDPLDCAIFEYLLSRDELKDNENGKVLKRFAFTSELKRQCVIVEFGDERMFATKGAPEILVRHLKTIPDNYNDYLKYAASGDRVIALAYKPLSANESINNSQNFYENDLIFAGFLLFGSKLKEHAVEMCRTLHESDHKVLMITGDNLLTAMSVAEQIGIEQVGVEGPNIDALLDDKASDRFFKMRVFARAEPRHKEMIINRYKNTGHHTMMVGDGTNDVGALKAADVGVAMLETPIIIADEEKSRSKQPQNFKEALAGVSEGPAVKPGDASVAAPFTVKSNSLKSIIEIIQQGRSSLVTTIQMYKILALTSIINAFFMSFIDLLGIKLSEYQMFSLGLLSAFAFQAITNGKPLSYISKQRPLTTIFSKYVLFSITGQSIIHIFTFIFMYKLFPLPVIEAKFQPSVMNTIIFIINCTQTIAVFICNYIGRPFRENISENPLMLLSLVGLLAFVVNIIMNVNREINDLLEVVDIKIFSKDVLWLICGNFLLSYIIEIFCFKIFMLK